MPKNSESYTLFKTDFHQLYQPLCQYANGFLEDMDASEDVVQDIFLKLWEKKQDLVGKPELKYYLYIAVRNNCLTVLRKKANGPVENNGVDWSGIHITEENAATTSFIDAPSIIREGLSRLPARCREIFILSRVSQLTYQRIAETMGISVKTVENQMGKAIKILKLYGKEKGDILLLILLLGAIFQKSIGVFPDVAF